MLRPISISLLEIAHNLGNLKRKDTIFGCKFGDENERNAELKEAREVLGQEASLRPANPAMAVVDDGVKGKTSEISR